MNIFKFLKGCKGKLALSPMQAVGLAAVVGVAGIGAYQMMGSSEQPDLNTVFSSGGQDVVYVSGASGGSYGGVVYGSGGGYAGGGEIQSGIHTALSKDLQLMQADAARAEAPQPEYVQQEGEITAYKLDGASSGLGMGTTLDREKASVDMGGSMQAVQNQIAALQASVAQQQEAAAAQATAGQGGDAASAAAAAALQGGGRNWGQMASGMARASGSNLQSTPLQARREGQTVSASGVLGGAAGVPSASGALANGVVGVAGGRRSFSRAGDYIGMAGSLEELQRISGKTAASSHNSTAEGARGFLASSRLSGGIRLEGNETLSAGVGSSADFGANDSLSSLGGAIGGIGEETTSYAEDLKTLQHHLKRMTDKINGWSSVSWIVGWGQSVLVGLASIDYNNMKKNIEKFNSKWGNTPYETENTDGPVAHRTEILAKQIRNWVMVPGMPKKHYNSHVGEIFNANAYENVNNDAMDYNENDITSPYGSSSAEDSLDLNAQ